MRQNQKRKEGHESLRPDPRFVFRSRAHLDNCLRPAFASGETQVFMRQFFASGVTLERFAVNKDILLAVRYSSSNKMGGVG